MANFSTKPWNGDASQYSDANAWCDACLIDMNPAGQPKTKSNCKLPVKEPNGDINSNAVHAAASALVGGRGGVDAPPAAKKAAAKKLVTMYGQMNESCPPSVKNMAM